MARKKEEEKPITLSVLRTEMAFQMARFYGDLLEPRFQGIDRRFDGVAARMDEHDGRFDDLYKKMEDLYREYIISNEQIRRMTGQFITREEFYSAINNLENKFSQRGA